MNNLTFKTAVYGQMVKYTDPISKAVSYSHKVWFFNQRGVFLGDIYKFVKYDQLEKRPDNLNWQENHTLFFKIACRLVTFLIRQTQKFNLDH